MRLSYEIDGEIYVLVDMVNGLARYKKLEK